LLFAAHYHELYNLLSNEENLSWNYVFINKNINNKIQISYLIKEGISFDSMGLEMAISVGMNNEVINSAKNYKKNLENLFSEKKIFKNSTLFEIENKKEGKEEKKINDLIEKIKSIDINEITPKNAHDILYEIKKDLLINS